MEGSPLSEKVREALRTGKLPLRRPDRVWGGRGGGGVCSICHAPLKPDAVEFELEFIWASEVSTHHLHVDCFTEWERERDTLERGDDSLQQSA
jgi:hypothetical protein